MNLKNISEFDVQQLKLMQEVLSSFVKKQIELSSLVGSLEFLLNALESVNEDWEEKFLVDITTLETINALEIIRDSGEKVSEIHEDKKELLIKDTVESINKLINYKLNR